LPALRVAPPAPANRPADDRLGQARDGAAGGLEHDSMLLHERDGVARRGHRRLVRDFVLAARASFCARSSATRAFTSRFTSGDGIGSASGKRIVPFEVSYPSSAAAWALRIAAVIG